jgi:hypothetical protein
MLADIPQGQPMTKRQRLELHRTSATCNGCHGLMDPLGLPLESFDAIGRYRTTDDGLPIDPSGDIDGTAVQDAQAMGTALASDDALAECMVHKFYTYAVGHTERDVDGSVVNALITSFHASGYKLRDLIVETVTEDAFAAVAPQP